jgi:predicted nucleotidyltransferase
MRCCGDRMASIISFSGPDGVGKSTLAEATTAELRRLGLPAKKVWFRWPLLLSAPLVLYARLQNLYERDDVNKRRGPRAFSRSRWLSSIFPWAQAADCWMSTFLRARLPAALGYKVVADRCALDVLVDTLVATGKPLDQQDPVVRAFRRIHGRGVQTVVVDAAWESVQGRRSGIGEEERWRTAEAMYVALAREWGLPVVQNEGDLAEATKEAFRYVLTPQEAEKERKYYLPDIAERVPVTRPVLGNVVGAMLVHWLFQSLFYVDRTERLFKIGTDLLLGSLFFQLSRKHMSWPLASVLSIVGAHTVNLVFNAQPVAVLHDLGRTQVGSHRLIQHLSRIVERAQRARSIAWLGVYGSLARGEAHGGSDIDVRVRRYPGLRNAVAACLFIVAERTRGSLNAVPVDIYLWDSGGAGRRKKMREDARVILSKKDDRV